MTADRPLRIALLHHELGLGGAERLMVDAALALQARGHRVTLHAAAHDPARSFPATNDGRLDVRVRGRWLPLQIAGRLRLPLAVVRAWAAAGAAFAANDPLDALVCDTVSQVLPLLRWRTKAPFLFYGHYPDALLTPPRTGWYRWYRVPIDRWELAGLDTADRLLVNSSYTADAFRRFFPRLQTTPQVLHPGVDLDRIRVGSAPPSAGDTIAVISRLVAIKNLPLAIEAFAHLRQLVSPARFAPLRLVIAGGYDARFHDCRETASVLAARAAALGVTAQVEILRSPSDDALQSLLGRSRAVVYTPAHEHFGYVPIEAMAACRPVIAADSGGPLETVVDRVTGFLRSPTPAAFAAALQPLIEDPPLADRLGAAGRARVEERFSLAAFGEDLEAAIVSARAAVTSSRPR